MKLELRPLQDGKIEVIVEHDNQSLSWSSGDFKRSSLILLEYNVFEHINLYWAQLPLEQQTKIFSIYQDIKRVFDDSLDRNTLTVKLKQLITDLFKLHPIEDLKFWILFKNSQIHIPDSSVLQEVYHDDRDRPGSRDQTYLRSDYIELACLSTLLRLMIPIWGDYISRTKQETGNTFKEYYAFFLLSDTEIFDGPAIQKLTKYIKSNIPPELPKSAIIHGLGNEDYPKWILSLVIVRRVCTGDVRGTVPGAPILVTSIFKYIAYRERGSQIGFAGLVMDKTQDTNTSDEENGASKFEAYKVRRDITIGDKAYYEFYVNQIDKTADKLCPGIDQDMVREALETSKQLENINLHDAQITIARWIYKPIISPKAFQYFSKTTVVKTLAVSQCVLWHWGYHDLAAIITGKAITNPDALRMYSSDIKKYLPELDALYPYRKRASSKSKAKTVNPAVAAIESLAAAIGNRDWQVTIHERLLTQIVGDRGSRVVPVPGNIKARLASLVVDKIAKRSQYFNNETQLSN